MNKDKNYISQGLMVYVIASCLSNVPNKIRMIAYSAFITYSISCLIKFAKIELFSIETLAIGLLTLFLVYGFAGVLVKEFYNGYFYIFESRIAFIIRVIYIIVTVTAFGFWSYRCIDENNRAYWLKLVKIFSIICLIILLLIGILYIAAP